MAGIELSPLGDTPREHVDPGKLSLAAYGRDRAAYMPVRKPQRQAF